MLQPSNNNTDGPLTFRGTDGGKITDIRAPTHLCHVKCVVLAHALRRLNYLTRFGFQCFQVALSVCTYTYMLTHIQQ